MGLGKTIQSVSFVEHLVRNNNILGPFLVTIFVVLTLLFMQRFDENTSTSCLEARYCLVSNQDMVVFGNKTLSYLEAEWKKLGDKKLAPNISNTQIKQKGGLAKNMNKQR